MGISENQAIWNQYPVLELEKFCTIFSCSVELNDGNITRVTSKGKKGKEVSDES